MIITIHQPSYLPWIPFLEKALSSDVFVLLDDVQFEKNSEQNRNRIKTPSGPHWLTVPVIRNLHTLIPDVRISEDGGTWARKHRKTIHQYYCRAPYYEQVSEELFPLLEQPWKRLLDLNKAIDELFFKWAGFKGSIVNASELGVAGVKSDRILAICKKLGATIYLSGPAGVHYLDIKSFAENGIDVKIQAYQHCEYPQLFPEAGFLSRLSAVDLFLNVGVGKNAEESIKQGHRWLAPSDVIGVDG